MTDLQTTLSAHQQAVGAFLASARLIPAERWKAPRARGKWSPAMVAEHLALTYEANRSLLLGTSPLPTAPWLLRPWIQLLLFRPVLWFGRFVPGSRSPKAFRPAGAPVSQDVLLARLQAAAQAVEKYVGGADGKYIQHPIFGRLSLADFVRFQEIHTRHHHRQLPSAT